MTMELSSSFIHMTMVTSGRAFKTIFCFFGFTNFKEWLGVNRFCLHSAKHVDKTTNLFQIVLFVRATKTIGSDHDKWPRHSSFRFRDANELKAFGIKLNMDDAIMNYTATPLMDGSKAWLTLNAYFCCSQITLHLMVVIPQKEFNPLCFQP